MVSFSIDLQKRRQRNPQISGKQIDTAPAGQDVNQESIVDTEVESEPEPDESQDLESETVSAEAEEVKNEWEATEVEVD